MKRKYRVLALDVWGNEDDGFAVNDVYPSQGTVEIDDDESVIVALQRGGFASADAIEEYCRVDGEPDGWLFVEYNERPEFQLCIIEEKQQ